ncbi:MAG: GGDEF domain-containing protein [Candidatus Dormibacteraeota bacterium]|nr:GGDEF domain-containing protein [Candidatus Dormibacteraeota bacterium]
MRQTEVPRAEADPALLRRLAGELEVARDRLAGLPLDVAELISVRLRELQEAAHIDELTGALRRGAGLAALQREVGRARRHGDHRLAVGFIDLKSLKSVNDSAGHAAGDAVLRELAGALKRRLRGYDLVVRWGGDEFVIALSQAGQESALRILREVERDFRRRTGRSFDVGVAEIEAEGGAEDLVARADADLYARRRDRERAGESTQKRQGRSLHSPA